MLHDIAPLLACGLLFGIPIVSILTKHQRKMLEMRLQSGRGGDETLRAELDALRQEVQSLRNTSMQYDISFDSALQRMEARMAHYERRNTAAADQEIPLRRTGR